MNEQQAHKSVIENSGVVSLSPNERARMLELYKSARGYLEEMAKITARALKNEAKLSPQNLKTITVAATESSDTSAFKTEPGGKLPAARSEGSAKIIFRNGSCGVWEDPPGICRPCEPGE